MTEGIAVILQSCLKAPMRSTLWKRDKWLSFGLVGWNGLGVDRSMFSNFLLLKNADEL